MFGTEYRYRVSR